MPGERLVVGPNGVTAERYWDYPKPRNSPMSLAGGVEAGS